MSPAGQRCRGSRSRARSARAAALPGMCPASARPGSAAVTEPLSAVTPSSRARPSVPPLSGSMSRSSRASRPTLRKLERTGWIECGRRREATSESRYREPGPAARTGADRCEARPHLSTGVSIVCTTDTCPGLSDLELGEILAFQKVAVDKLTYKENW